MTGPVSVRVDAAIAFVTINSPPMNTLSHAVRTGLFEAFTQIRSDTSIDGVVLHGEGRCFSAGGDIREFGTPAAAADPGLSKHVHAAIERCGKTVVAALHGFALGGGLETALACHARVATPDARLALPEARLGVIPLSGTQRLPRLIGAAAAIDMIVNATEARAGGAPPGLVDAVAAPDELLNIASVYARQAPATLVRDMRYPSDAEEELAKARAALAEGAYPAFAAYLLDAIACGIGADFDKGMQGARAIYDAVVDSAPSRAAQARFFADKSDDART